MNELTEGNVRRDHIPEATRVHRPQPLQEETELSPRPMAGVRLDQLPEEYEQAKDPFVNRLTRIIDMQGKNELQLEEANRMMAAAYLSARTGFNPDYTYRNIEKVAEWIEEAGTSSRGTMAHLAESWQRGQASLEASMLANEYASSVLMGAADETLMERARLVERMAPAMREDDKVGIAARFLGATAEQLPRMAYSMGRGAAAAAAVGGGVFLLSTGGGAPAGAALIKAALPAAGMAMKGTSIHALAQGYAGSTFLEVDKYETSEGDRVSPEIAAVASKAVGSLVAIPEFFAISRIPGVRESAQGIRNMAARAAGDTVARSLITGVLPRTVAGVMARWGGSVGIGVANEVFQETIQILGVEMAKTIDTRINENPWERQVWENQIGQDGNVIPGLRDRYNQIIQQSAMSYATMGVPGTAINIVRGGRSAAKAHRRNNAKSTYETVINAADLANRANIRQDYTTIATEQLSERVRIATEEFQATPSKEKAIELARFVREQSRRREPVENMNRPDAIDGPQDSRMSPERAQQVDNVLTTRYQSAAIWNRMDLGVDVPREHQAAFVALVDMAARSKGMDLDSYVATVFQDDIARMGDLGENRGKTLWDGAKALIVLGKNSDASTLFHELGHVVLPTLSQEHMTAVDTWWAQNGITTTKEKHESFSRALEYYLYEGRTAHNDLHGVFARIRDWMKEVYRTFRMEWEFTPEIRQVFDQLFLDEETPGRGRTADPQSAPANFTLARGDAYDQLYDILSQQGIKEPQDRMLQRLEWLEKNQGEAGKANEQIILNSIAEPANAQAWNKFQEQYHRGDFAFIDPAEAMEQINREQITTQAFNLSQSLIPDEEMYQGPASEYADYAWRMKVNSERARAILESSEYIPDQLLLQYADDPVIKVELDARNELRQEAMKFMQKTREYGGEIEGMDGFIAMTSMDHAEQYSVDYLAHIWESAVAMDPENVRNPQLMDQAFVERMTPEKLNTFMQAAARTFAHKDTDTKVLSEIFKDDFFVTAVQSRKVATNGLTDAQIKNFTGKIAANPRFYRKAFAEMAAATGSEMKSDGTGQFHADINEAAIELDRILAEDQFSQTAAEASKMSEQVFELRKELRDKTASYNSVSLELKEEQARWAQTNMRRRELQGELETMMLEQQQNNKITEQERKQMQRDIDRLSQEDPMVPSRISRLNTSERVKQRLLSLYEQDRQHKETLALIDRIEKAETPMTPGKISKLKASDQMKQRLTEIHDLHRGYQQNQGLLNRLTKSYKPLTPSEIKKLSAPPEMKQRLQAIYDQYKADMQTREDFRRSVYAKIKLKKDIDRKIKNIMREPSHVTTNFDQAQEIREIQARFSMRQTESLQQAQEVAREILATSNDPEIRDAANFILNMKPITELSLDELTVIDTKIEEIREAGRRELQAKKNRERLMLESYIDAIISDLGYPDPVTGIGSIEAAKEHKSDPRRLAQFSSFRPWGVAEMLSNHKKGAAWSLLWDQTNDATNAQLRESGRRIEAGEQRMKALGLTDSDLRSKVIVDGKTYSKDQVIGMYLLAQNDEQMAALQYGNSIDIEEIKRAIAGLSDNEKKWGDFIHDDFQNNFERLRSSYIDYTNRDLGRIENYFPLIRESFGGINVDLLIQELMGRMSGAKKMYAEKRWSISRKRPPNEKQSPVRLDATSIWEEMVSRQEKFISHGKHVRNLHRIFGDNTVQRAMAQKFGHKANQWIRKYTNDITNANFFRTYDTASQMSRLLRTNLAISVLAFNPITMLRQTASLAYGLHHARPANMIGAATQLITNRAETVAFIEENSPQVKYRSSYRVFEDFKAMDNLSFANKQIGKFGMAGIQAFDKVTVYTLWKATYDYQTNKGMDHNTAVKAADQAVLETQPASRAKDLSEIQRGPEGMQWFMLFSNQLNQIWTNVGYRSFHSEGVADLAWQLAGVSLGAVMIGAINRRRLPRDHREVGEDIIDQLFSSVPIAGDTLSSQMTGSYNTGVDPLPIAGQVLRTARTLQNSEADTEQRLNSVIRMMFELGKATGVPTVQPERMLRMISEQDPWQFFGGGPRE